jgi:hypothetical protein
MLKSRSNTTERWMNNCFQAQKGLICWVISEISQNLPNVLWNLVIYIQLYSPQRGRNRNVIVTEVNNMAVCWFATSETPVFGRSIRIFKIGLNTGTVSDQPSSTTVLQVFYPYTSRLGYFNSNYSGYHRYMFTLSTAQNTTQRRNYPHVKTKCFNGVDIYIHKKKKTAGNLTISSLLYNFYNWHRKSTHDRTKSWQVVWCLSEKSPRWDCLSKAAFASLHNYLFYCIIDLWH